MYGGYRSTPFNVNSGDLYDLYELNMLTLLWTQIQTSVPALLTRSALLSQITENHLGLYSRLSFKELPTMWIFNVKSHKWRQYPIPDETNHRFGHTAITGLNSDVVILGGKMYNRKQNKPLLSVKMMPKSLQQLAMRIIFANRTLLSCHSLPTKLIHKLSGI